MKMPTSLRYLCATSTQSLIALWMLGPVFTLLEVVRPWQLGQLTDLFAAGADSWRDVLMPIGLIASAQVCLTVVLFAQGRCEIFLRETTGCRLRDDLFDRILRFHPSFFDKNETTRMSTRTLQDVTDASNLWADLYVSLPVAVGSLLIYMTQMLCTNAVLGLCVIPFTFLSGFYVLFDREFQRQVQRERESWDAMQAEAVESIRGVEELRHHGAIGYRRSMLSKVFSDFREKKLTRLRLNVMISAISQSVRALEFFVLFLLGVSLCLTDQLNWGEFIAFTMYVTLLRIPLRTIFDLGRRWQDTTQAHKRILKLLAMPMHVEDHADLVSASAGAQSITLRDVGVTNLNGDSIIAAVNLTITAGEHVTLAGPAGSGKSTVLRAISGDLEVTSGDVVFENRSICDLGTHELAGLIGYVPQVPIIFRGTIRSNILLGLRRTSAEVLYDQDGALDIGVLDGVTEWGDVDNAVTRIAKMVGLTDDLLHKGLDYRAAANDVPEKIVERIGPLRVSIREQLERITGGRHQLVLPFAKDKLWEAATVRENLFGCGSANALQDLHHAQSLLGCNGLEGLVDCLLGFARARTGEVGGHTTLTDSRFKKLRLERFWKTHESIIEESVRHESWELGSIAKKLLLDAALDSEADDVAEFTGIQEFEESVIQARRVLFPEHDDWLRRTPTGASTEYIEGVTVRDNVLVGRTNFGILNAKRIVLQVIERALVEHDLLDEVVRLGLEYEVGDMGKRLSGGQRQKIAWARVLLKAPKIVLLDEATASMDAHSRSKLQSLIETELSDCTVISISHHLNMCRQEQRVVVLDAGRVVQDSRFGELREKQGVLRNILLSLQ